MGLSRLSTRCKQCPYVDNCNDKRMEALAYLPDPVISQVEQSFTENMAEPILRETMTIMINGKPTIAYRDEVEKQLYDHLYSGLGLRYGG